MLIYLAGKIAAHDWRHDVVRRDDQPDSGKNWQEVSGIPLENGDTYVGPFFISCDHSCSHSPHSHGAGQGCQGYFDSSVDSNENQESRENQVRRKAINGICDCDVFFVYLGLDFSTAFGTMAEIGAAHAWRKKIVMIIHPALKTRDFWFLKTMADKIVISDDPAKTVTSMLEAYHMLAA